MRESAEQRPVFTQTVFCVSIVLISPVQVEEEVGE